MPMQVTLTEAEIKVMEEAASQFGIWANSAKRRRDDSAEKTNRDKANMIRNIIKRAKEV